MKTVLLFLAAALTLPAQLPKVQSISVASSAETIAVDLTAAAPFENVYIFPGASCMVEVKRTADGHAYFLWDQYGPVQFNGLTVSNGLCTLESAVVVRQLLSSAKDGPQTSVILRMSYASGINARPIVVYGATAEYWTRLEKQ